MSSIDHKQVAIIQAHPPMNSWALLGYEQLHLVHGVHIANILSDPKHVNSFPGIRTSIVL